MLLATAISPSVLTAAAPSSPATVKPAADAAPPGYERVAIENQTKTFSAATDVAYGAYGKWLFQRHAGGPLTFNNLNFGDPYPGIFKYGFARTAVGALPGTAVALAAAPSSPPPVALGGAPAGYSRVAAENGAATFATKTDVAYGADGKFVYRAGVTGRVVFDNATFGDPIPGVVKSGYARNVAGAPAPTAASPASPGGVTSGSITNGMPAMAWLVAAAVVAGLLWFFFLRKR